MGVVLWLLECVLSGAAAYSVSARLGPSRPFLERAMVALGLSAASGVSVMYGLGAFGIINRAGVGWAAFGLNGAALVWAVRGHRVELEKLLRQDLGAPGRLVREILGEVELMGQVVALALLAVGVSAFIIWRYPSWSWDCVWYHVSISNYVLQSHGNGWIDTHINWVNGYPRNLELLSAWSSALVGDTRLDDSAQLPFAFLGAFAVAAYCRRFGAGRALAASLGAMWMLTPAVCLQMHTTHADIAAGALFVAGVYFLTQTPWTAYARWVTALMLGLYLGSKVTGLFHLVLLSPLILWRVGAELRHAPGKRAALVRELLGAVALCLALGAFTYARNLVRFHNPFWPVKVVAPIFGELNGTEDPHTMAWPPAFFGGSPGAVVHMLRQWYTPSGNYYPDVREGPFGVLFAWLTFPCYLLVALFAPFDKRRWQLFAVLGMGVLAVLVPVAWWGRYTLGMPAAALISVAVVSDVMGTRRFRVAVGVLALLALGVTWGHDAFFSALNQAGAQAGELSQFAVGWGVLGFALVLVLEGLLPVRGRRALLSAWAAGLTVASYAAAVQGYRSLPTPFADVATREGDERRLRGEAHWLWPYEFARYRDEILKPGDVVTYDSATAFLAEYWTPDLRNRVEYVDPAGNDTAFFNRLHALRPVLVSVRRNSSAERTMHERSDLFRPLFDVPVGEARMYQALNWNW
jgi:hypothetical protein